ncbi:phosphoribosyltransferase [Actinomycetaceae bacterium WB03_NA08]|uniref:Phosphoribosyltransferase n=1 Tax=Scrofimicrobium canadense TaxID=2652290 RepID=A0A6N7WAV9_9ACTO|nr:phosphoribosyltransferase [Scrofimicrobium canadense]MSS85356.1 phosphoribosyltransferase [Scrofimicrobium canadense]
MTEREILTWEDFGQASRDVALEIVDSGWHPDFIIAVARGGLPLAGALAYALDIKPVGALNVEFYTGVGKTLPAPVLLEPGIRLDASLGQRALIVDDVADSGRSLRLLLRLLRDEGIPTDQGLATFDVRTAVLYHKPRSVVIPDYSWMQTEKWISFPWSTLPPVTWPQ